MVVFFNSSGACIFSTAFRYFSIFTLPHFLSLKCLEAAFAPGRLLKASVIRLFSSPSAVSAILPGTSAGTTFFLHQLVCTLLQQLIVTRMSHAFKCSSSLICVPAFIYFKKLRTSEPLPLPSNFPLLLTLSLLIPLCGQKGYILIFIL